MLSLVALAVLGVLGFVGFQYVTREAQKPTVATPQNSTLEGLLMRGKGDDYSFILLDARGKTTGITSQTIQLDAYVNKNVEVTGQYSGTTLYAQTVTEKK